MCPSRRRVIAGAAAAATAAVGSGVSAAIDRPPTTVAASSDPVSASDWPMSRYDPAGTAFSPTATGPKSDVELAWTAATPAWFAGTSAPTLHNETVYAAGSGLVALDIETGTRRFGFPGAYRSTPAVARTKAYDTPTLATTAPAGLFGVNASGGIEIPGLNRPLGGERWAQTDTTAPTFFRPTQPVAPVTVGDRVYVPAARQGAVRAVDATNGEVRWQQAVRDDETAGAEIRRPAVRDGTVFVTNWPYQTTAYDVQTGAQQWQRELADQLVLPPVATPAGLIIPSRSGVQLLDADDGTTLWKRDLDGNATESTSAVANGRVFLTDEVGSMYALELATGETEWTAPFDGATAPVVADGIVYAVRSGIELVAFDAATGARRFRYVPSQVPLSPPAIANDRLYLANRYRVIALESAQ